MLAGQIEHQAREFHVVFVGQFESTERVALARVEAGRDHHQLRLVTVHGIRQGMERGQEFPPAGAGRHRPIHRGSEPRAAAGFLPASRPRIPRPLVRAEIEDGTVLVEDLLGAVAVVHVPVDDQHLADAVLPLRISGGDAGVVENAKAHAAFGRGMMSRRTHQAEGIVRLAAEHGVDADARRAGCIVGRRERVAAYPSVARAELRGTRFNLFPRQRQVALPMAGKHLRVGGRSRFEEL